MSVARSEALQTSSWVRVGLGIAAIAQLGAGIAFTATPDEDDTAAVIQGSVLISTGLNGLIYSFSYPQDDLSYREYIWEYFKETVCAIPTGLLYGAIGSFTRGAGFAARLGAQICGGAISAPLSEVTHTCSRIETIPSIETLKTLNLKAKVISGSLRGAVGESVGALTGWFLYPINIIDGREADMMAIVLRTLQGGIEGIIVCSTCQIVSNKLGAILEGKDGDLRRGVVESLVIGGGLGAALAGAKQYELKERHLREIKTEQLRQEIKNLQQEIDYNNLKINTLKCIRTATMIAACVLDPSICVLAGIDYLQSPSLYKFNIQDVAEHISQVFSSNAEPTLPEAETLLLAQLPVYIGFSKRTEILQVVNPEIINRSLQTNAFFPIDETDWNELAQHIVLVHAMLPDSILQIYIDEFDWERADNLDYRNLFTLQKITTTDGVIGSHLDCKNKQFKGTLTQRPHIHWSWNQLVQGHKPPNSSIAATEWEGAAICVLEPLSSFEDPMQETNSALGIAPYDTFIIGSHQLSAQSTILVPETIEKAVRGYLTGFQGKVISYQPKKDVPFREEVYKSLQQHYPETWHIVDDKGHKLATESHVTHCGFEELTCIEKTNGERIVLISQEGRKKGQVKAQAIKNAVKSGKYLGLHVNCTTYWLESKPAFYQLDAFKRAPSSIKEQANVRGGKAFFAGYVKDPRKDEIVVLEALAFYNTMHQFPQDTKAWEVGNYILQEAVYADIMSLLYVTTPDSPLLFTPYELHLMIVLDKEKIADLLSKLHTSRAKSFYISDVLTKICFSSTDIAHSYFHDYNSFLQHSLHAMIEAKNVNAYSQKIIPVDDDVDLLLDNIMQHHAWLFIQNYEDFESKWPLSEPETLLFNFINKTFDNAHKIKAALCAIEKKPLRTEEDLKKYECIESMMKMLLKRIYYLQNLSAMRKKDAYAQKDAWCKDVMTLLCNREISAKEIIDALSKNPQVKEYYDKSAGVVEGYSVGQHTQMVLELAQRYREFFMPQISDSMDWGDFLLFLALHDIGKGVSNLLVDQPGMTAKELELEANRKIATDIIEKLWLRSQTGYIFQALLMYDSQGDYLKGNIDAECFKNHILDMSAICNLTPRAIYQIYHVFHLVDAASYPNLQPLFIFEEERLYHCDGNQSLIDCFVNIL